MRILIFVLTFWTSSAIAVNITASSWIVADESGKIIQQENADSVHPMASITKLMTVMVVRDAHQDLTEHIQGLTRQQLILLALVHSDNRAAETLCEHYPGGRDACLSAMNTKAQQLGMQHTHYHDASGLSVFNDSTARDLVLLVKAASKYDVVKQAATMNHVEIRRHKKWYRFFNTNPLIGRKHKFIVSKTGFTNPAGGCIAMMLDTDIGRRIVVVLGSRNTHTRIPEAEFIADSY